jgi:hypothetical protein
MPLILGGIVMWSGTIENIPIGWKLCDGTEGTVDLRNKFIVGAGDIYSVNDVGGSANAVLVSHSHTGTTGTSSNHGHNIPATDAGFGSSNVFFGDTRLGTRGTQAVGNHSHTLTINETGQSGTNANLPPYYALAFIQQIQ